MSEVRARVRVQGIASQAEALWYDTRRWASFVDGLAHVDKVEGDWPDVGSRVVWSSRPGGRGRVVEVSERHITRMGQTVRVEDERLRGTQRVSFTPDDGHCVVELVLEFELKAVEPSALRPLVAFFTRRPLRDSLQRTLDRFAVELRGDLEATRV